MQLRATDAERRDIGGALADALGYFDDAAPFVKLLNLLGPWAGLIDGLGDAIYNRVLYVADHRRGKAPSPDYPPAVTTPTPGGNGRLAYANDDEDIITAPDPGAYRR
jgi:hypothetical protein